MERKVKNKDTLDATPADSEAAKLKLRAWVGRLMFAMRKECSIPDVSLNDLENEYKLETGFLFTEKVILVLGERPYSYCIAQN